MPFNGLRTGWSGPLLTNCGAFCAQSISMPTFLLIGLRLGWAIEPIKR
jgi:hypothetical protein